MHVRTSPRHPRADARAPTGAAAALLVACLLGACSTTYDLTLMPSNHGTLLHGTAVETPGGQASISIEVGDRLYTGNWVKVTPEHTTTYVGASSWGWAGWGPFGGVDRSTGDAVAKALLQAADGTGMRCDLFGLTGGQGTGKCTDDKGLVYDVQIRTRNSK